MTELSEKETDQSKSPVFGSWRRIYWFVAIFFFAEVGLFYLFTKIYS